MAEFVPVCLVLLAEAGTADTSRFEAEVKAEGERITSAAETSTTVTVAFNLLRPSVRSSQAALDLSALDGLAETGLPPSLGTPIDSFDAVLEVRGPVVERFPKLV